MGRHAGIEVGGHRKKTIQGRQGQGTGERRSCPAHLSAAPADSPKHLPHFHQKQLGRRKLVSEGAAGREQERHQLLRSSWGGGMGHLLEPEVVGGSPWRQG